MIENVQNFVNDVGDEAANSFRFRRAFVTGRIGGVRVVEAGRNQVDLFSGDSDVYSGVTDWIKLEYGNKAKIAAWYGKPTALNGAAATNWNKFAGAKLSYDADKWGAFVEYNTFRSGSTWNPVNPARGTKNIWGIGAHGKFGDFGLEGLFLHGKEKNAQGGKKSGWTLEATYKGAVAAKPGSWGLAVKYYDQGNHTMFEQEGAIGMDALHMLAPNTAGALGAPLGPDGLKGWRVKANYTFAKNIVGTVHYYDLKGKGQGAVKEKTIVTDVVFTF
jgi:hypothetical protein